VKHPGVCVAPKFFDVSDGVDRQFVDDVVRSILNRAHGIRNAAARTGGAVGDRQAGDSRRLLGLWMRLG
jgi:hypothetical protein